MNNFTNDMMDELLVKYLLHEASPAEQKQVTEWIGLSADNQRYFEQFRLIWDQSSQLAGASAMDENKAWERFQLRVGEMAPQKINKNRQVWLRIAASFVIIAGATLFTYLLRDKQHRQEPVMLAITTISEVKTDTLPDGSIATLNKRSGLSYPSVFKGKTRKVTLKGEAFFNITPDQAKPFIIDVNDVQIKVVGTSFNVKSGDSGTEVIVETGIVQVSKGAEIVELKAGERILLPKSDTTAEKEVSADKLYNYYVSHTFVCDNTPLWKLVDKLNEAFGANIIIARRELRGLPLTVTFDGESLDVILNIISQTLLVKISSKDNRIIIN